MFTIINGNLFDSPAQALVNPVNCVGTMGAGLAREFRLRFPEMHADYLARCARGEVRLGELTAFHDRDKLIINLPTKHDWRERSKLAHIESGLRVLRQPIIDLPGAEGGGPACSLEPQAVAQRQGVCPAGKGAPPLARRHRLHQRRRDLLLVVHDSRWLQSVHRALGDS
jgi:hypothetical protein